MVKSIKWELLKQLHRSGWVIITMLFVYLILLIIPGSLMKTQPYAMSTVILILTLALIWGTVCPLIYSVSNLISDFVKPTYQLERSTGRNYLIIFLIKLGFNVLYVLLSTLVVIIGRELISKFDTENMKYFLIHINRPYFVFMFEFAIFYPITLLFVFLFIKNLIQSRLALAVVVVLAAGILYQSASYWKGNAIPYVVTLVVISALMLYGAVCLAQNRVVKS